MDTPSPGTAIGPQTRPLVWEPVPEPHALGHDHWMAPALEGAYHMAPDEDRPGVWLLQWVLQPDHFCTSFGGRITSHGSPEDAQTKAEADLRARLLPAP